MELTLHINDKAKLYTKSFFAPHFEQTVTLLYQPIIGIEAASLYHTLWTFIGIEKGELVLSHRQLLTFFNWDLQRFAAVRNKLEAAGLLNVFYNNKEGYYVYELLQPLNAKQFFQDSNLNMHLLYAVGDNMYEYLEKKFIVKPLDKTLVNMTQSFTETFQLLQDTLEVSAGTQFVTSTVNHFEYPLNYNFDFELFTLLCGRSFIKPELFTDETKKAIYKEAALYNFDARIMADIALSCMEGDVLNLEKLHEDAREYYKRAQNGKRVLSKTLKPAMTEREFNAYINKKQLSDKEVALKNYKTKTPLEWLRILQSNTEVPPSYLDVVRILYEEYELPSEVINVLLEFVRTRNDGRLPAEYAKTVASSWVFNRIKTAEEAIAMVEKIQDKEKEFAHRGEIAPTYRKRRIVVEEPKFIKEAGNAKPAADDEPVDMEELKKLLASFK